MKKFNTILISIIITSFLSCNNNNNNDDECGDPVWTTPNNLENEYNCVNTKHQMDIDLNNTFTIIRSQESFEKLVTGSCTPQIDFSTYDLLIGKKSLNTGNESIDYSFMKHPCNGELYLQVDFVQNSKTDEAPNLTYHALIPKLNNDVNLNVELGVN